MGTKEGRAQTAVRTLMSHTHGRTIAPTLNPGPQFHTVGAESHLRELGEDIIRDPTIGEIVIMSNTFSVEPLDILVDIDPGEWAAWEASFQTWNKQTFKGIQDAWMTCTRDQMVGTLSRFGFQILLKGISVEGVGKVAIHMAPHRVERLDGNEPEKATERPERLAITIAPEGTTDEFRWAILGDIPGPLMALAGDHIREVRGKADNEVKKVKSMLNDVAAALAQRLR